MSAVKTLAFGVAASIGLGMGTARAEPLARGRHGWTWTLFRPAHNVSPGAAPSATPRPTPTTSPQPAPVAVAPIVASSSPSAAPALVVGSGRSATSPVGSLVAAPPASASQAGASLPGQAAPVDAYINMTSTNYPAATLTTGTAQPWYDSPAVIQAFHGSVPNAQQQANFVQTVLQDVEHTYQLSGMNPTLTTDPGVPALHTLSVVSGLSAPSNPNTIGLTNVGGNGFSFIDKLDYADNPAELAWAVAHNVAHELMHAFGIGYHPDSGNDVDAGSASWSTLVDPSTRFGPAATRLLLASQYGTLGRGASVSGIGAEPRDPGSTAAEGAEVLAVPAPEPVTAAMWILGALAGMTVVRRRARRSV